MLWRLPSALLLLAGAIPLILFLHSLKPRGVKIATTALFLWERVLKERPLGTRLGWLLRKNVLLILQLLAAMALIAALADPRLRHFGATAGDMVVVIDLSASMKAKGKSGSRFDAARREYLSLVDSLASEQKMMVIGAGAQPRLLTPFTADKRRLRELGRNLEATDAAGRVKEAILFAHAFLKRGSPDRVVVVSYGAFAGAEEYNRATAHFRFIKVEGGTDNVAIVGFEVRRHPEHPERMEIMVHVRNYTARAMRVPLVLSLGERTLIREEIELGADDRRVVIYPYDGSLSGALVARLEITDDFSTDNHAYLAVIDAPTVRILYVGPGNPYLSNLLRFFANVQVTSQPRWEQDSAQQGQFDVIIFDRVAPPALKQGNFLLINAIAPNLPLQVQGKVQNPQIVSPLAKHPVTEGLSLGDVKIHEALRVAVKGEGSVLARAQDNPLIYVWEKGKLRLLFLGFDLMTSDLPLRVAFPVLLHNALGWLQPQQVEFPGQSAQAGTPFALRLPVSDEALEITMPSGNKEKFTLASSPLMFADTTQTGFYAFKSASREGRFAINLFDEAESQILPRVSLSAAAKSRAENTGVAESGLSLWPALVAIVLILLGLELLLAFRQGLPTRPIIVRAVALTALVVALVNPRIFKATNALDVILGVDLSRSVGQEGREKALEILQAAVRTQRSETRTGLLTFARAPEWESLPREQVPLSDFGARLDRDETDIQAALQAAVAQVGEGRQGKILLISDGNENRNETARVIPLLRTQGVSVWTLPVSLSRGRNEIYLSDLTLPRQVDSAEGFEIRGAIESMREAPARVRLLRDGSLHAEQELQLKTGSNPVVFRDSLRERGNHTYELLVESPGDTLAENNLLQGVVEVKGPPRVLLLSAQKESQRVISRVLQVQGYAVAESVPEAHPLSLSE